MPMFCHSHDVKKLFALTITLATLAACGVDTTGLSPDSSRGPHPRSNANAIVTVLEYSDLQCPACKGAQDRVIKPLLERYGSQMRLEFRHFPLTRVHAYALAAAEASECAADQGKFWEFTDLVYSEQEKLNNEALDAWGVELRLDQDLFDRCRASHIKRAMIMAEETAGEKLGVNSTPTFFVNGTKVESSIDAIGKRIEEASAKAINNL